MWFLRLLLVLLGTAVGFYIGGNLTQDINGAVALGFVSLLLMVLITKRRKEKQTVVVAGTATTPAVKPPRKLTLGRVVWSIIAAIGVSGVLAILKYVEDEKDRERNRRAWAEQQYQQQQKQFTEQFSSSISGRVFDSQTRAPLGNAVVGYMSGQGFVTLARTAPDGSYRIDRPFLTQDHYPIRIAVVAPGSQGRIHYTNEYLQYGQKRPNVVIYVLNQPIP